MGGVEKGKTGSRRLEGGGEEADGSGAEINREWGKIGRKSRERALPGAVWEESALGGQRVQSGGGTNPDGVC